MWTVLLGLAAGGAAAYFYLWDTHEGSRRRAALRDRLAGIPGLDSIPGMPPPAGAPGERPAYSASDYGRDTDDLAHSVATHPDAETQDGADSDLAQKVRSQAFEALTIPHGGINVNAERGVVVLRGQVETAEEIAALEAAVRRVDGVKDVDNRLHVPGAPSPN